MSSDGSFLIGSTIGVAVDCIEDEDGKNQRREGFKTFLKRVDGERRKKESFEGVTYEEKKTPSYS